MSIIEKLKSRYFDQPRPDAVFQVASDYLTGIRIGGREGGVRGWFIRPLTAGGLEPAFDRRNLTDLPAVAEPVREGLKILRLSGGTAAVLIPEPCVRVFVLAAESLPSSQAEREAFLRWRVGKQMPLVPEDAILDYAVSSGPGPKRLIVGLARRSVVREYEELFEEAGVRTGMVTIPSLSLVNLLPGRSADGALLLNVEADSLGLLAVVNGGWTLYRQKSLATAGRPSWTLEQKFDQVVQEVENTVHFLEDKEKQKVDRIWVRCGILEDAQEVTAHLGENISLPVAAVDYPAPDDWGPQEKSLLAPLVGQVA